MSRVYAASTAQHNIPSSIHTKSDVRTIAKGEYLPKSLRICSGKVLHSPCLVRALLHLFGHPQLFGDDPLDNLDNLHRILDLFLAQNERVQIMIEGGHLIPEPIGWVPMEDRTVNFRWDGNDEVIAEFGGNEEETERLEVDVERESAYAWVCGDEEGRNMNIRNAGPMEGEKREEVDAKLE